MQNVPHFRSNDVYGNSIGTQVIRIMNNRPHSVLIRRDKVPVSSIP